MHALFADWYLPADPSASSESVTKRWAAIEELVATLSLTEALEFAAFLARRREHPARLVSTLKQHDEAMATRGIEELLRVLASVVLHLAVERGGEVGIAAALSLLSAAFGLKDEPKWLEEHVLAAATFLTDAGRQVRKPLHPIKIDALEIGAVNDALDSASMSVDAIAEANNFLWWTFTKHSASLAEDYSALPHTTVALAASVDIFSYARRIPIAPEAETLLLHVIHETVGLGEKDFSFKNYFSGLSAGHATRITRRIPAAAVLLCPVHAAIGGVAEGKAWVKEFERAFGIRTASVFSLKAISTQYLRELSLAKLLPQ